jgi:hypothetical protein
VEWHGVDDGVWPVSYDSVFRRSLDAPCPALIQLSARAVRPGDVAVPEPASLLLFGGRGLAGLGFARRRKH